MSSYSTTSSVGKSISYETVGRAKIWFSPRYASLIRTQLSTPQYNIPFIIYLQSMSSEDLLSLNFINRKIKIMKGG